jgi:predicted transcriptional regulator
VCPLQVGLLAMPETQASISLSPNEILRLSAGVAAAYVSNHQVERDQISELVRTVYRALTALQAPEAPVQAAALERLKPAVPIARSVQPDHIVCLEDGRKLKMLKRYLRSRYNLSPEEYRRRWGLPADYPMVAPAYAERRSQFAREIGLGKGVRRKT